MARPGSSTGPGAPAAAGSRSSTRARPRSPSTCASPASGRAGLGPCGILNLASPRADWSISTGRGTSARRASSTSGDASTTTPPSSSAGRAADIPAAARSPGARTATYASTPKGSRTGTRSSLTSAAATFSTTRSGRPCRRRRASAARAAPRPSKSGVPFAIDSVNAEAVLIDPPRPRAL